MPKEKKLLIATIILAVMLPISAFGLSLISEVFLLLGMYCGISALFCGIILMDLKSGKSPNLIPIGFGMALFGFAFFAVSEDDFPIVRILLSVLYIVIALLVLAKGIKNWHDMKRLRGPKPKKPMNKKIYIGIGLIVCGYISFFTIYIWPPLMCIGYFIVIAGIIVLVRGINQRKKDMSGFYQTLNSTSNNARSTVQVKIEHCARCGKNLYNDDPKSIFEIDGKKYCSYCKAAIDRDVENQHTICSVCGIDLPIENMHVIGDKLLCHSCFLKKYGNVDSFYEDE